MRWPTVRIRDGRCTAAASVSAAAAIVSDAVACFTVRIARALALVGCRKRGSALTIAVWVSGIGIPDAERERIFEEFFQIGNPERDRRNGLGLGLPIARRISHLLGSELVLHSTLGRGSVFALSVQLGDPSVVVHAPAELAIPATRWLGAA